MLKDSLGMLEVKGLVAAITVGDTMAKAANVHIRQKTLAKGHGWTTILVTGDVGSVNAALSAGKSVAVEHGWLVSSKVIARPASTLECALEPEIKPAEEPSKDTAPEENPKVDEKSLEGSDNVSADENTEAVVNTEDVVVSTETEVKIEPPKEAEITETSEIEVPSTAKKTTRSSASKSKKTKSKK